MHGIIHQPYKVARSEESPCPSGQTSGVAQAPKEIVQADGLAGVGTHLALVCKLQAATIYPLETCVVYVYHIAPKTRWRLQLYVYLLKKRGQSLNDSD